MIGVFIMIKVPKKSIEEDKVALNSQIQTQRCIQNIENCPCLEFQPEPSLKGKIEDKEAVYRAACIIFGAASQKWHENSSDHEQIL